MDYKKSISKEEINQLPRYIYEGTTVLIESKKDALAAIDLLKGEKVLGFDTETRAAFRKGEVYDISLLQLATKTHVFLFRLNKFKLLPEITELLADPSIVKAGVAVGDDIKGLKKLLAFKEDNFIDLARLAKQKGFKNFGLRALTAIFLGKRMSKKEKISNWAQAKLTTGQMSYAAIDADAGLKIYQAMISMPKED